MDDRILATIKSVYDKLVNHYKIDIDYDDVYQDLHLKLLDAQQQYKPELASFRTYWNKIIKNYIRDVLRRYRKSGIYTPVIRTRRRRKKQFFSYFYRFDDIGLFRKFSNWLKNNKKPHHKIKKQLIIFTNYKGEEYEQYRYRLTYEKDNNQ